MVQQIHSHVANANSGFKQKLVEFIDWTARFIVREKPAVYMGDLNMSLCIMVQQLRIRGITIDVAAWCPHKSDDGTPKMDSCFIAFIDLPGKHMLFKEVQDVHPRDSSGILWSHPTEHVHRGRNPLTTDEGSFHKFPEGSEYNQELYKYIPKTDKDDIGANSKRSLT